MGLIYEKNLVSYLIVLFFQRSGFCISYPMLLSQRCKLYTSIFKIACKKSEQSVNNLTDCPEIKK